MADSIIHCVKRGEKDISDEEILCIYAKKPPEYAVYRNSVRVMVQFADDTAKANQQRLAFAALNALRGQISGLIDGWRDSEDEAKQARARRYDRRVADAIITAFEGGIPDALALLAEIRDDIIAERKSIAQTDYLIVAALFGIVLIILIGVVSSRLPTVPPHSNLIWTGAAGGVLGAFFSIATGLRSRSILIDLQQRDNRRDALLRVTVGTLAGGILLSLFLTDMASIGQINRNSLTNNSAIEPALLAIVLGFIAGFSERAVPQLLSRASVSIEDGAEDVAVKQAKVAGAEAAHASSAASRPTFGRTGSAAANAASRDAAEERAGDSKDHVSRTMKNTKAPVHDEVKFKPGRAGGADQEDAQAAEEQPPGGATQARE